MITVSSLDLAVLALAVWRISNLLTRERGPWHWFRRLRERVGITHDGNGFPAANPETFLGELLTCQYCFTIWAGALATLGYLAFGSLMVWAALPFALSAGALWINRQVK